MEEVQIKRFKGKGAASVDECKQPGEGDERVRIPGRNGGRRGGIKT